MESNQRLQLGKATILPLNYARVALQCHMADDAQLQTKTWVNSASSGLVDEPGKIGRDHRVASVARKVSAEGRIVSVKQHRERYAAYLPSPPTTPPADVIEAASIIGRPPRRLSAGRWRVFVGSVGYVGS